jgi:hypothetical protein
MYLILLYVQETKNKCQQLVASMTDAENVFFLFV